MGLVDRYYYGGAGHSAMQRYNDLARQWRRRTFGRRAGRYIAAILLFGTLAAILNTPDKWHFEIGLIAGALFATSVLMPQVLLPDQIARWERGAWGEQSTSRTLRRLNRRVWNSRHDLATGFGDTNRDHIVVGRAVYLLDSKFLRDEVVVEPDGLHVRNYETGDEYRLNRTRSMLWAAKAISNDLYESLGFRVWVYPVVVIWSWFPASAYWDGEVAYVAGEQIAEWIADRPADLLTAEKQAAVKTWLKELPQA